MPRLGLKGLRGITLFQQFSLLSFIWMVITTLVGGYLVATLVTQAALQRELETVSHFVGAQVMQHRLPEVLEGPDYGQRAARLAAAFATLRETAGVVRVKVFDREGRVVWSDEPRYNGKRFQNQHVETALAGQAVYELEIPRGEEHLYEQRLLPRLIELYMPLLRGGLPIGVVEVYRDAAPLLSHIRRTRFNIWLISILGGLTIFLSMQLIVRRASSDLIRMQGELKAYSEGLEHKVQERTRELQATNEQLEGASRHKSEFLANMSHELRTPLNSIIGFADLLLNQGVGPLSEKQVRYLGHILQGGKHLLQLISDILDLSKVEAGKFVLKTEALNVATTLEDILVIGRGLAHKKSQTVTADIEADLLPLRADPVRFKQILFNLLSNAVKFTPDGGRVTVTARQVTGVRGQGPIPPSPIPDPRPPTPATGEWLELAVADTGIGVKAEDMPRLFQEFVQLETTQDKRQEGTGLGLALTKQLVEMHGGRIWAESEGKDKGSTFTVVLPFAGPGD